VVLVTAEDNAAAVLTLLNTALAPRDAYELDKVPSPRPPQYVEITLSRMFGGERRQCGSIGATGYRVTVRAVSQSTVSSVRRDLEKCRAALEFNRLSVGAHLSTPIQFETEDPAAYDSGWFSGLQSFTYVIQE